jgi:ComF family protein
MTNLWLKTFIDFWLPPTCLLCGNPGFNRLDLCEICYRHLPRNNQFCLQCGQIMAVDLATSAHCGQCISSSPAFDETFAPFIYQDEIKYLITSLKFGADYKNARLLGQLLAQHLPTHVEKPELILPVPLHKSRYRERGFNQSIEIARTISKTMQIPIDLNSCQRQRNTTQQSALAAKQRKKNMKNAFVLKKPISAQHVVILDDVMTTGSTVNELAKVLKKAGVKRVDVWVCARA